jgi:hypothetical protein
MGEENVRWSTQQDNRIETVVKAALVRNRPRHIQARAFITHQEIRYPLLPPDGTPSASD